MKAGRRALELIGKRTWHNNERGTGTVSACNNLAVKFLPSITTSSGVVPEHFMECWGPPMSVVDSVGLGSAGDAAGVGTGVHTQW